MTRENTPRNYEALMRLTTQTHAAFEDALTPDDLARLRELLGEDNALQPVYAAVESDLALRDFATIAGTEALAFVAMEIEDHCDALTEELHQIALDIYYAVEDEVRAGDASLIPHLENMRRAYQHDYGEPIPARPGINTDH